MRLKRFEAGDYRTPDGRWQIIQPRGMDNGLQHRWIIREWIYTRDFDREDPGWFALDDDYPTLREAREALSVEIGESAGKRP